MPPSKVSEVAKGVKLRTPGRSPDKIPNTMFCPVCWKQSDRTERNWIEVTEGTRDKLDEHLKSEHPGEWERVWGDFEEITKVAKAEAKEAKTQKPEHACACNTVMNGKDRKRGTCDATTRGRFAPGHDARLKGRMIQVVENAMGEDKDPKAALKKAVPDQILTWLTDADKPLFKGRFADFV